MNKTKLLATAFAVAALSFSTASANVASAPAGMEACKVVNAEGKNLVLAGKADGVADKADSAGTNAANEADAWIWVPVGQCEKLNHGDFSGASDEVKAKLDTSAV